MSLFRKIFSALTYREKIIFVTASLLACASLAIVIGIIIEQSTTVVPSAGGDFTEGIVGQPEYVNPVTAETEADLDLVKMVYANADDLAANVDASADKKTWTLRLKEGLSWQDGQKLTSDDVIFTVQAIQDPDAQSPEAQAWAGISVSRVSELEVQFTLTNPNPSFNEQLKDLYILPKHLFADIPAGNWHLSDYDLKPVGSGPYEFISYDREDDGFITKYHLAAWDSYAGTKPLIQNFDFAFFANDDDLIKSFNAAQIDGFAAQLDDLPQIERPYDLSAWQTPTYYAIFWNQSNNQALQDNAVRLALSEAVDRNSIVGEALDGKGEPDYGPIPPQAPYGASEQTTSSIMDASTTLTNDGWTVGTDGFRSKTDKKGDVTPLTLTLTVPDIGFLVQTADLIQASWKTIGVNATIATDTPQNIATNEIPNRAYDGLLFGNTLGPTADLDSFWNSAERFSPGLNLALYDNPKADNLMASIQMTADDASRTQMFSDLQATIIGDNPAVFLYSPDDLYVNSKNVRGIATGFLPDPSDRLREVVQWYLNTARVLK